MRSSLTILEAIQIAEAYHRLYFSKAERSNEDKETDYQIVTAKYHPYPTQYSELPTWEVCYDRLGWDDVWYSIVIVDKEERVVCCSNMWKEAVYPHIKADE